MSESYCVSVRALCEFTAKHGDLDSRFTPSASAHEGLAGHKTIAARRAANYQSEISLARQIGPLRVRGRADGYDPDSNRLEEFKTHRGDLGRMPENQRELHWAQLKIYGALFCRARNLPEIELALVYFDVRTELEALLRIRCSADVLESEFAERCERFLAWARTEMAHRNTRNAFLTAMTFPHASLRATQRDLAEAVYRTACGSAALMIEAPTGIGKTLGTVFPLLKAVPKKRLDRVFFLVAKISGRAPALEALKLLVANRRDLRVLEYVSRQDACEHPGSTCDADSCPLAKGFYDRLPAARLAAMDHGMLDRATVREAALSSQICPYYLTQELARWSDFVVADYHYYFDARAALFALTNENQWRIALLVDEAHNLLPRGRDMYSATLAPAALHAAMGAASPGLCTRLEGVRRAWVRSLPIDSGSYRVIPALPEELLAAIEGATAAILDALSEDPDSVPIQLREFFFAMLRFGRLAESFGRHSIFDASAEESRSDLPRGIPSLTIRNIIPATFLAPRFAVSTATVLFSATLSPAKYYRQLLGLPEKTAWLNVASPFGAQQLAVRIVSHISTRYADRRRSIRPIVEVICAQFSAEPGNYLAFFSSFDYLEQVFAALGRRHPQLPLWRQSRRMLVDERDAFLDRFSAGGRGIGFAVLGGRFGEGVDLPGDRLIGAFIATLGLPQFNSVNAQVEERMREEFGAGFEYTYLYPGIQKVVQAAGRVIRTCTDQGSVHLIDDRYAHPSVRRLLPQWWRMSTA